MRNLTLVLGTHSDTCEKCDQLQLAIDTAQSAEETDYRLNKLSTKRKLPSLCVWILSMLKMTQSPLLLLLICYQFLLLPITLCSILDNYGYVISGFICVLINLLSCAFGMSVLLGGVLVKVCPAYLISLVVISHM